MIFALILFLAFVVFLAFFVGLNIGNTCTFWFFKTYSDVPAAVLVLIAFGAGIIVALLFMVIAKLRGPSDAEIEKKEELQRKREAARVKSEEKMKKLMSKQKKKEDKARKEDKVQQEAFSGGVKVPDPTDEAFSADK